MSLSRTIAVCNQKGGVGKTTTSINAAAGLAVLEKKVLLIDVDPQCNASQGIGFDQDTEFDIYHALCLDDDFISCDEISKCIYKTDLQYLDIIPCTPDLAGFEIEFSQIEKKELKLKKVIASIKEQYDYIILDSPPSLNLITVNILTAADSVLIPVQCEYYAIAGLAELLKTIGLVQNNFNRDLKIEGLIFTMFDSRLNLSRQVVEDVKENFSGKVFKTIIPRNVRLSEAPSFGKPVVLYDVACTGAVCYLEFVKELLENE